MTKNQKTKRTQIKDLAVREKQLTASESRNVKGGAKGIKDIKIGLGKPTPGKCGFCGGNHSDIDHPLPKGN